jgi:ureidoglycolate lyase
MTVHAVAPDAASFAPFGAFVEAPAAAGERRLYSDWLAPVAGLTLQVHTNRVPPTALPCGVARVERHPHAAQLFLPLSGSRYLVTVMPPLPDGRPDAARAQAFIVPATLGIAYRPGTWHTAITALDAEACFAVLMWRGAADDDILADVPLVHVEAAAVDQPVAMGGRRG